MPNVVFAQADVRQEDRRADRQQDRRKNHRTDWGDRGRDDLRQDRNPDAVVLCPLPDV